MKKLNNIKATILFPLKIELKLRITIFLFLAILVNTHASTYSQNKKISLDLKDVNVETVLQEIESLSEFNFLYNDKDVDFERRVTIKAEKEQISKILHKLFSNTNTIFSLIDKQIILKQNSNTPLPPTSLIKVTKSDIQQLEISGTVKDSEGNLLPGVTIAVEGTNRGTDTDFDGKYNINASAGEVLVFSYVGMTTSKITIANVNVIDVILKEDALALDEVVIVGFGEQKKVSVIGAIQSIKPELLRTPSTNLTSSFAGRISGVISVQRSGEPGADGANFWIRGISTFGSSQNPLIIIDGVEASSGDLNALAPEVIENFSVLKDATATALYGAKGANGVMVVKTKSGQLNERTHINLRIENRISQPTQIPTFTDGVTYMEMYNEAKKTRAIDPNNYDLQFSLEKIEATKDPLRDKNLYPNVNWYDEVFKDATMNQTVNLNITGGSKNTSYFISALLNHDTGLFKHFEANSIETAQKNMRYSFQNNLKVHITPTTIIGLRVNAQIQDYRRPATSTAALFSSTLEANPVLFPKFYPNADSDDDNILFGNATGGPTQGRFPNPFAQLVTGFQETYATTVLSVFDVTQDLNFVTPGLKANALLSFKNWSTTTTGKYYNPTYYQLNSFDEDDGYQYEIVGTENNSSLISSNGNGGDKMMNFQFNVNYDRTFNDVHNVSGMMVYLQRDWSLNNPYNFVSSLHERNQGLAGRVTYNYDDRYFIEGNFGYNGSENFSEGNRFGFFPSAAVGYMISNEKFFKPLKSIINTLKVRASYGKVGNSFTSPRFPYVTEINANGGGYAFGSQFNNYNSGPVITKYGNELASWEVAKKLNLGLEFKLFNKVSVIADYFIEDRSGIFMQRNTVPAHIGIGNSVPWGNIGEVQNKGIDLNLDYNQAISEDFIINFKSTLTISKNKLIEQDEPEYEYDYMSNIGQPLLSHRVLVADGLFVDQADIDNSARQTFSSSYLPGDIKYKDLNSDGVIDDNDRKIVGDPYLPQIVYGFGTSVQYKKWDVSLFFQGTAKTTIGIGNISPFGTLQRNVLGFVADNYWSEANPDPNATYPRLDYGDNTNNLQASSYWLRDGSFLRLKNMEIGFSYKKMRAYVSGTNLLTFSKFDIWDPELGGGNGLTYPLQKVFNLGVQFNL
jgi:TonB-linked SusC/RagA family outer membrane protein